MSYKAGKVLTFGGNNNLVERLQTSGPGSLNIPTERIQEAGNELSVSVERDTPDLSFDLESFNAGIAIEAMFCRRDPLAMAEGDILTFGDCQPLDISAPIKGAGTSKTSIRGVLWPHLYLEQATYRFGVRANATESFTLRGDSQYGVKGTPYVQEFPGRGTTRAFTIATTSGQATIVGTGSAWTQADVGATITTVNVPGGSSVILSVQDATHATLTENASATAAGTAASQAPVAGYAFAHTGVKTVEIGADVYAYNVTVYYADGTWKRLFHGANFDYTDTSAGFTLNDDTVAPVGSVLSVCYGSAVSATFPQTIHTEASVLPGAVRAKHINVFVGKTKIRTFQATTATGDATLTGVFLPSDEGAALIGAGIPPGTTIDTVTDGTHAEMSANATASATVSVELRPELVRWRGVQSIELTWRVNLDYDDELGNPHHVSFDYDIPDLTGTITLRPESPTYLFDLWQQIGGAAGTDTANVLADEPLEVRITIADPNSDTGALLKTFRVPDARIQPPPHQVRAGQKVEPALPFASDSGLLQIAKGAMAA